MPSRAFSLRCPAAPAARRLPFARRLQAAINRYLGEHNRKPKPFVWTADPDRIIEKVNRGHQAIASDHHVDNGYRGHNHKQKFRVWITGQARGVTVQIRREMKRRAAVERRAGYRPLE
jgi:hypothetical protein